MVTPGVSPGSGLVWTKLVEISCGAPFVETRGAVGGWTGRDGMG